MSGYGYANRGSSTYNGVPPRANEWSEASYASDDHVCRPVIVDAEGRKTPIVVSMPNLYGQGYVAKVERVVEHVRVPVFTQYRQSSQPKIEPVEDYGYRYSSPPKVEPEKMYGRYSSPPKTVKDYGYRRYSSPPKVEPVKDYGYKVDQPAKDYGYKSAAPVKNYRYKAVEPMKDYGYKADQPMKDYGYKAAEPVKGYGYKAAEPVKEYEYKVEPVKDYGHKTDPPMKSYGYKAAEPMKEYGYKTEPVKDYNYGSDKWRRPSSPPEDRPQEAEEFITKVQTEASRPNRFPINAANWRQTPIANRNNGDYDDNYRKNDAAMEPSQPSMVTSTGGWSQPAHDAKLGKPTSDIATAMENLKEAATALSVTTGPYKRNSFPEIIGSKEGSRQYSKLNVPSGW